MPLAGLNGARAQCLLAYLLLHRDAPVARQHLAFLFWPDSAEAQARTNLRNLLHSLMQILPESERFVQAEAQTVQWRADAPFSLDVDRFHGREAGRVRRKRCRRRSRSTRASCCPNAMTIGSPRIASGWPRSTATHCSGWWTCWRSRGPMRRPSVQAQRLVRHDPLRESVWRQIMRLHALNGDRAGVARAYRECKAVLKRELDVEPSAETEAASSSGSGMGAGQRRSRASARATAASAPSGRPMPPPAGCLSSPSRGCPISTSRGDAVDARPATGSPCAVSTWASRLVRAFRAGSDGGSAHLLGAPRASWRPARGRSDPGWSAARRGCMGGSKAGLMNDPDVRRILAERYNLVVKFDAMGSRDMAEQCTTGYDFVWPGTEADVERFKQKLARTSDTPRR